MKPYKNIKLEEFPDVADIIGSGRKSIVGTVVKEGRDYRGLSKSKASKKQVRRHLKRKDKGIDKKKINKVIEAMLICRHDIDVSTDYCDECETEKL